jgi:hypothetical protein
MKKTRKLILSRETLHSLELRNVAGGVSFGPCGTLAGTTVDTNRSNTDSYTTGNGTYNNCTTGGACSGGTCSCGGTCAC